MGINCVVKSFLLLFLITFSACQQSTPNPVITTSWSSLPTKTNLPTEVKTSTVTPTNTPTPTKIPTLTRTPTLTPTPTITATPRGGGFGQISLSCFVDNILVCGVFLVHADGRDRIQLVDHSTWSMDWSADGEYLAYDTFFDDAFWICRLAIADRTELCIPNNYNDLRDIALSPDGSKMIISGDFNLVIWDLSNNTINQTTEKGYDPSWVPDNKKFVYSGKYIYLYDIETKEKTQLTSGSLSFVPVMSPDGKKIVYNFDSLSKSELYMMNVDGSNKTRLTFNDRFDRFPSWSPDSSKIAYISFYRYSKSGTEGDLYIYDLVTKQTSQITKQRGISSPPSWSPDGKWIAFAGGELNDLFIIRIEGSEEYLLVDQVSYDFAWRP